MQTNRTKRDACILKNSSQLVSAYKFFLSVMALLRLLQKLLSLVQLGVHQLLLQVFVLYYFVYVLVGFSQGREIKKSLLVLFLSHVKYICVEAESPRTSSRSLYCS